MKLADILQSGPDAVYLGRLWSEAAGGPIAVGVRDGLVIDLTTPDAPTVRDISELPDPLAHVMHADGPILCHAADLPVPDGDGLHLLPPCDLQAIKAAGVTFVRSMVERVIEERAGGDPDRARDIRDRIGTAIGGAIADVVPGSEVARRLEAALRQEGLWSQYLEVGIGPDAEIFTKAQVMSAVGHGATIGVRAESNWNNPEPEAVIVVNSRGEIIGATLGNDVNLRDFEGRSALLLSKAKDNNASCAIGPMIRLFGPGFGLDELGNAEIDLTISGPDGFAFTETCKMAEISRPIASLVRQTIGPAHQYPDGFLLFLGTPFSPNQDRQAPGRGFTHLRGDKVTIASNVIGLLENEVADCESCPPWTFGASQLFRNLAERGLLAESKRRPLDDRKVANGRR